MFGNKLRLEREITTVQGQNKIRITDKITNFGSKPSPYTILYHMNLGFPLLTEDAELIINPAKTTPRDDSAASGIKEFKQFIKPRQGFREQVFDHVMSAGADNIAVATLKNKKLGIALSIKFNISQLPYLVQWKMMGQGEYVLGLEPSNIPGKNRKILKEENLLPMLQPDESSEHSIEVVLDEIS